MFTKQIGTLIQTLMGRGMSAEQADSFSMLGNCLAPLQHNGPVSIEYDWPPNASLDDHAALTLRTQGTALNIPQGNIVLGEGVNLVLSGTSEITTEGGESALNAGYICELTSQLDVDGSATAKVQIRSGGAWIDKTPTETLTVYDAFLTGNEVLPSGTRVGVSMRSGTYVVDGAQSN